MLVQILGVRSLTHMRVCLNSICAKKRGLNQSCRVDPCQVQPGEGVCGSNLTCVPSASDPSMGTCQSSVLQSTGYLGCDPGMPSTQQCPQGTTCEPRSGGTTCGAAISDLQNGKAGLCVLPVAEGQGCDGNFDDPNPNLCARCESGTTCVLNPGESRGMCRRSCTSAADCPCGGASACLSSASGNYCRPCAGDGLACRRDGNNDVIACCKSDQGSVCDATTNWRCCRPNAVACTENGQCCGTNRCISGQCGACRAPGESASNAGQCCEGLILAGGICKRQCNVGPRCTVPGTVTGTACSVGQIAACDAYGNVTTCTQRVFPTTETCNGVDDNCNGTIDEGLARTTCSGPTRLVNRWGSPLYACGNGGAPQQGVLLCERGAQVCTAFEGYHFCDNCGTRNMPDPTSTTGAMITTNCGGCGGNSCLDGAPNTCMPGLSCTCPSGPGTCGGPYGGSCSLNTTCSNAPNRCWARNPSGLYGPTCI